MDLQEFEEPAQYGTSMHYPYCQYHSCTGCIPDLAKAVLEGFEKAPKLNLQIFKESRIETRPQDWAAPARAILEARGAWRS